MTVKDKIEFMLSLRYDPHIDTLLPRKTRKDFTPLSTYISPEHIESSLLLNLENKLSGYDKIGISLGSGVDSPLVLAMAKKLFPKKEILAFVANTAEQYDVAP